MTPSTPLAFPETVLEELAFAPLFGDQGSAPLSDRASWARRGSQWCCEISGKTPTRYGQIAPSIQMRGPSKACLRIQIAPQVIGGAGADYDAGWAGNSKQLPRRRHAKDSDGTVETDLLRLSGTALGWRLRLTAYGGQPWEWSWGIAGVTWRAHAMNPQVRRPALPRERVEIKVPVASQMAEGGKDGPVACSPTCLQMQLAHRGVRVEVPRVMKAAYDPIAKMYGNWQCAVNAAWQFGCPAAFVYFRSWEQVLECLHRDIPVSASVKFPRGVVELPGAPIEHSSGHLIVVRGLTPGGEVIVNDPAAKSRSGVPRVYPLDAFTRAWFGFSGVGYLVFPPQA